MSEPNSELHSLDELPIVASVTVKRPIQRQGVGPSLSHTPGEEQLGRAAQPVTTRTEQSVKTEQIHSEVNQELSKTPPVSYDSILEWSRLLLTKGQEQIEVTKIGGEKQVYSVKELRNTIILLFNRLEAGEQVDAEEIPELFRTVLVKEWKLDQPKGFFGNMRKGIQKVMGF